MTTATLVDSILQTRIVTRNDIDACRRSTGTSVSDEQVIQALVEQGRLTAWQLQNIRAGHVNFMLDHRKYLILDQIGVGGMGAVYRARHLGMNTERAVKVIDPKRVSDPLLVERFRREVQVCSQLDHENIVRAYDVGSQGGGLFLVLEYVAGADLSRIVRRDGPMSCEEAAAIIMQAACGLAYAHGKGVVHRDIKPGNILLSSSGVVKILDMGLARIVEEHDPEGQKELTRDGEVMGTVAYMPAEQARNARDADHRSDIYSLGATLYSLLTGHTPYDANGHFEIISQLVTGKFTPIGTYRSDLPEGLQLVVHKMLAHRPEDRYQAASDIVRELTPFAATELAGRPVVTSSMQAVAEQVEATLHVEPSDVFSAQTAAEPGAAAPVAAGTQTVASGGSLANTEAFALANQSLFTMANVTQHRRKRDNSKWIMISTLVAACLATAVFVAVRISQPDKTTDVDKPDVVKAVPVKNGPPPTDFRIRYDGHLAPIWSVAWSPDSTMVATGGVDAAVLVWRGPNVRMRYDEHEGAVISLEWGPRGQYIASVDIRGNIDVWDTVRGTRKRRITRPSQVGNQTEEEQYGIVGVGLHPGIKEVAVNSGPHVQRWSLADGKLIDEFKVSCAQLKYSPSGQLLAGCTRRGELYVWQITRDRTAELLLNLPKIEEEPPHWKGARTFRWVDGERLAIVTDSGIDFWGAGWSEPREDITFPDDVRESEFHFVEVSGDGTRYLLAYEPSVTLIDSKDGRRETFPLGSLRHRFRRAFTDRLDYVVYAADGAAAIRIRDGHRSLTVPGMSGQSGADLRIIGGRCLAGRNRLYNFETAQMTSGIRGVFQMDSDDELLAFIETESRLVKVVRAKSGVIEQPVAHLEQSDGFQRLRWTNDGHLLWAISDDRDAIRFWSAESGRVARTVDVSRPDPETKPTVVAVSHSGNTLAVVDGEFPKYVRIWSNEMTSPGSEFELDFANSIRGVALSPDGKLFVTDRDGNQDAIQVRDSPSGKLLFSLKTDFNVSHHALRFRFSPSGRYLLLPNCVWDLQGPRQVWKHEQTDRFVATHNRIRYRGGAWAGDDDHVVMAQDGRYTVWNWRQNRKVVSLAYLPAANWVAFNHLSGHWTGSTNLHRYVQFRQAAADTAPDRWYSPSDFEETFERTNDPQQVRVAIPSDDE